MLTGPEDERIAVQKDLIPNATGDVEGKLFDEERPEPSLGNLDSVAHQVVVD